MTFADALASRSESIEVRSSPPTTALSVMWP
jgi:hypothetical protein